MWAWRREFPYFLHRVRCLYDLQTRAHDSPPITQPMYTRARVAAGQPLPEVTVVCLQEAKGRSRALAAVGDKAGGATREASETTVDAGAKARQGKEEDQSDVGRRQTGKLPERDAVFSFVVEELSGDLYQELLEGLRVC